MPPLDGRLEVDSAQALTGRLPIQEVQVLVLVLQLLSV
jgi:hypothetical protein